jgi:phenylacetate-CoA ligase
MDSSDDLCIVELINFARKKSPYYAQQYTKVPEDASRLDQVPLVDHASFWTANTSTLSDNKVLTSDFTDGLIFRTGGTTAAPKTSYVARAEFHDGGQNFSRSLVQAGLLSGDRVANMLFGGDLYKGFLELGLGLMDVPIENVHQSIGGATSFENQSWTLDELSATVVVVMPTVARRLAEYLVENGRQLSEVRLLLYLGEHLPMEQRTILREAFPRA